MNKKFPAQWGNAPQYTNPSTTLPMPMGQTMPIPLWIQTKLPFRWTGPFFTDPTDFPVAGGSLPNTVYYTFEWDTPIFDLRPDLRSAQAAAKNGVPIWNTGARLYLQLFGLLNSVDNPLPLVFTPIGAATGLTAIGVDQGNAIFANITQAAVADPTVVVPYNSVQDIGPPETITNSFIFPAGQPDSTVVGFAPPGTNLGGGDGYPLRYWRLRITFTKAYQLDWVTQGGGWTDGVGPTNPLETPASPAMSLMASYY